MNTYTTFIKGYPISIELKYINIVGDKQLDIVSSLKKIDLTNLNELQNLVLALESVDNWFDHIACFYSLCNYLNIPDNLRYESLSKNA